MPRRTVNSLPRVSLGGVVHEPALRLAYVEYPELYGTLFRFGATPYGPFSFCTCSEQAVRNLAELNTRFPTTNNADPRRLAVLDSLMVPAAAAAESIGWAPEHIATLSFEKSVCHRCSQIPPSRRWCHEMYGDPWKQAYGWFPYLAALEGGVHPWQIERFLPNAVPTEVRSDLADYAPLIAQVRALRADEARDHSVVRSPELKAVARRAQSLKSRVMRHFTSEARVAFGFKRVGEGWVAETMLFRRVQGALPAERLIRHFRGEWLEGLELDIYAPSLNLGIEYQGEQHSSPVAHWGGAAALERQRQRDARKRELCQRAGCTLIEVWAGTEMTDAFVRTLLTSVGVTVGQRASPQH